MLRQEVIIWRILEGWKLDDYCCNGEACFLKHKIGFYEADNLRVTTNHGKILPIQSALNPSRISARSSTVMGRVSKSLREQVECRWKL